MHFRPSAAARQGGTPCPDPWCANCAGGPHTGSSATCRQCRALPQPAICPLREAPGVPCTDPRCALCSPQSITCAACQPGFYVDYTRRKCSACNLPGCARCEWCSGGNGCVGGRRCLEACPANATRCTESAGERCDVEEVPLLEDGHLYCRGAYVATACRPGLTPTDVGDTFADFQCLRPKERCGPNCYNCTIVAGVPTCAECYAGFYKPPGAAGYHSCLPCGLEGCYDCEPDAKGRPNCTVPCVDPKCDRCDWDPDECLACKAQVRQEEAGRAC